jgi:hypothetical protein
LSHLTVIKQKNNEPISDYVRRFRNTRNWCFNLNISAKDLANLDYSGVSPHLKEKLESLAFSNVSQVLQMVDCETRAKESRGFSRSNDKSRNDRHVNLVYYDSES